MRREGLEIEANTPPPVLPSKKSQWREDRKKTAGDGITSDKDLIPVGYTIVEQMKGCQFPELLKFQICSRIYANTIRQAGL